MVEVIPQWTSLVSFTINVGVLSIICSIISNVSHTNMIKVQNDVKLDVFNRRK